MNKEYYRAEDMRTEKILPNHPRLDLRTIITYYRYLLIFQDILFDSVIAIVRLRVYVGHYSRMLNLRIRAVAIAKTGWSK